MCLSNNSHFSELAPYVYPKRKSVELAADRVAPQQSKLVVEFVQARPTAVEETDTSELKESDTRITTSCTFGSSSLGLQ